MIKTQHIANFIIKLLPEEKASLAAHTAPSKKQIKQWLDDPRLPIQETIDPTLSELIQAKQNDQSVAFYYFGGSSPRQLRKITVENIFRTRKSPHAYVSGFCHLRREQRIFRADKLALA
ncbi:WYL domain-containing protein [Rubritalea tangerina]|uniref:WYL domain-containing protein n=2 Tax=Rubritalea tangerina TaxID=430798 RepID=A0ABW4ZCL4_9BACT